MRKTLCATVIGLGLLFASLALAGARNDVRVHTKKDTKGRVVYKLTNNGARNVKAKVSYDKDCRSTTTSQEPTLREYWLQPGTSQRLRRVMANSDCRHIYRIVNAEYY